MSERVLALQPGSRCVRASWQAPRRNTPNWFRQAITIVAAFAAGFLTTGAATGQLVGQAALDQQTRTEAINSIPFDQLTEPTKAKLWNVVSQPSIYRRLPVTVIESDPDMHVFLIRYPEVIVNMWQLMGVTKVQVDRTGDYTFKASDGAGTVCDVQLVYGDQNTHVYYAEGSYEGVLLRRLIRGSSVLVLKSDYRHTADQEVFVTNRLDMFVQLDNVGAEILAKTLHPLVGKAADHNFTESNRFLSQVSEAAERRSAGLQQLAGRLNNVGQPVRERFVQIATEVNHRATLRDAGRQAASEPSQTTPETTIPVATEVLVREGESPLFDPIPPRKPLRLRR